MDGNNPGGQAVETIKSRSNSEPGYPAVVAGPRGNSNGLRSLSCWLSMPIGLVMLWGRVSQKYRHASCVVLAICRAALYSSRGSHEPATPAPGVVDGLGTGPAAPQSLVSMVVAVRELLIIPSRLTTAKKQREIRQGGSTKMQNRDQDLWPQVWVGPATSPHGS